MYGNWFVALVEVQLLLGTGFSENNEQAAYSPMVSALLCFRSNGTQRHIV
jgi:hypothetical protein